MIVIIGLVILFAAVLVGIAGVFANGGDTHTLTDNFAVFGYHVTGSTGVLFLYGIVVGGVAVAGLSMVLAGDRRTARRGRTARHELEIARRDATAVAEVEVEPIEHRTPTHRRRLSTLFRHTPTA